MTRLLPPIPDDQRPIHSRLSWPRHHGRSSPEASKCTQGNCKAWRSHDAHKAPPAHVNCSIKATTQNTTHQRCVNAVQAKELRNPMIAPQAAIAPKAAPPRQEVNLLRGLGNRLVESLVATQNQILGLSWAPLAGCIMRRRLLKMTLRPHIGSQMSKIPLPLRSGD